MDFDDFIYHVSKIPADFVQNKLFFDGLKNKFFDEMKQNKNHTDYFNKYNPGSIESFMLHYATQKASLASHYKYMIDETNQNKELKYRAHTEKIFNLILQKKLWDIQLKWRAEQIQIKEIRTSWDFFFWDNYVSSCPFVPAVTEAEIEIMKAFLRDDNFSDHTKLWYGGWQNYGDIMEIDEYGDLSALPDWYEFYDLRMGTGLLLQLPDIRGKKEEYYLDIARNYYNEKSKKNESVTQPIYVAPLPYLHASYEEMYNYARANENDKHFIELFRINKEMNKTQESYSMISDDEIDHAVYLLKEAEFPVVMPGNTDWRDALMKCSQQYMNSIIANELDVVYEEYKLFLEIGISRNNIEDVLQEFENDPISQGAIRSILKGREICGEPQNLDF
ncbi:MAG: hypothetical protein HOO86_07525 [Bacteroidales bacterium]|nr:hypothetical protein [Bacteroidales bacterium]